MSPKPQDTITLAIKDSRRMVLRVSKALRQLIVKENCLDERGTAALATACGVSRRTVQRWGRGELFPSPDHYQRIRNYLRQKCIEDKGPEGWLVPIELIEDLTAEWEASHGRPETVEEDARCATWVLLQLGELFRSTQEQGR